jgi:hypothetical protein
MRFVSLTDLCLLLHNTSHPHPPAHLRHGCTPGCHPSRMDLVGEQITFPDQARSVPPLLTHVCGVVCARVCSVCVSSSAVLGGCESGTLSTFLSIHSLSTLFHLIHATTTHHPPSPPPGRGRDQSCLSSLRMLMGLMRGGSGLHQHMMQRWLVSRCHVTLSLPWGEGRGGCLEHYNTNNGHIAPHLPQCRWVYAKQQHSNTCVDILYPPLPPSPFSSSRPSLYPRAHSSEHAVLGGCDVAALGSVAA